MCVRKRGTQTLGATDQDWYFENKTVQSTIELVRYLMKKYHVSADHVIRHYDVTGKICPNPYVYTEGKNTWETFQKGISEKNADQYVGYRVYNTSGKKVYVSVKLPYRVQVKTGSIPVRKGPAKTCRSVKRISGGTFEITEEKNGFGKLKSGAGWIYLKKVKRV